MRILADRDRCVGSGQCVLAAPGVFEQDEDEGLVVVTAREPSPGRKAEVAEAVGACPARAISLLDN